MLSHLTLAHQADEAQRMLREVSNRPRLDREDAAAEHGRIRRALTALIGPKAAASAVPTAGVTIRRAALVDAESLVRLAAMSDRRLPTGAVLVAEIECEIVAAVPLDGGPAVTDIRRPTADVLQLLELRSAQVRNAPQLRSAA